MDKKNILNKMQEIYQSISPDTDVKDIVATTKILDLGLNSLQYFQLILMFESAFEITFDLDLLANYIYVSELIEYIYNY